MTPESTIVALWVAWLASWGVAAFWSNRTEKGGGIVAEIAFRTLFWASATLLLAPFSYRRCYGQVQFWHLNDAPKWILVALTATGFSFVWWARIHLGRLWSDWLTKRLVTMSSILALIALCAIRSIWASSLPRSQPPSRKELLTRCLGPLF